MRHALKARAVMMALRIAPTISAWLAAFLLLLAKDSPRDETVIPPFLTGFVRRVHAAIFSFIAGVMPPMPML
ncbi:hypothetical protein ACSSV8_003780, partial [Roseovarius sp. MBR-79]